MATFKKLTSFEVARGVKAFLSFAAGVTRGPVLEVAPGDAGRNLEQARSRVARQREQLADKDRKIARLQKQLAGSRAGSAKGSRPEGLVEAKGAKEFGIGLRAGAKHYRAWVGPPARYDVAAAVQVTLLLSAGLRDTHRLVEIGCGSLRAGRLFIPYLRPGNYFGVEPNQWVVEEGIQHEVGDDLIRMKRPTFRFVDDFSVGAFGVDFDFALAQSIFTAPR